MQRWTLISHLLRFGRDRPAARCRSNPREVGGRARRSRPLKSSIASISSDLWGQLGQPTFYGHLYGQSQAFNQRRCSLQCRGVEAGPWTFGEGGLKPPLKPLRRSPPFTPPPPKVPKPPLSLPLRTLPTLLYVARRAFAGCAQLRTFHKSGKKHDLEGHMLRQMPLTNVKKFHVGMSTSLDACSLRCINLV